jgi:hypothetical protein
MLGFGILNSVIFPVIMLLALSFFILFALRKLEPGMLRNFGSIINLVVLGAAGLFLIFGVYAVIRSEAARHHMMQQMMKEQTRQSGKGQSQR